MTVCFREYSKLLLFLKLNKAQIRFQASNLEYVFVTYEPESSTTPLGSSWKVPKWLEMGDVLPIKLQSGSV